MLGWFKKKFSGNKREEPAVELAEQTEPAITEPLPLNQIDSVDELREAAGTLADDAVEPVDAEKGGRQNLEKTYDEPVSALKSEQELDIPPLKEISARDIEFSGEDTDGWQDDLIKEIEEEISETDEKGQQNKSLIEKFEEDRVAEEGEVVSSEKPGKGSLFKRLQECLGKTRQGLMYQLDIIFLGRKDIDYELLDKLEEILITADLGVNTTMELLDSARRQVKRKELSDPMALKKMLRDKILDFIRQTEQPAELVMPDSGPFVIMVVGVNGVGKTTTIGKIANKFKQSGQSVLLIAGDTFRAAAIGQLQLWGERVGVEVIAHQPGSDPSSVIFDGIAHGVSSQFDVIIIDTAGRLHTSVNLMEELKKIKRVIGKKLSGAPHEVMLVIDATTGQNGIAQAKLFNEAVAVTGLALTKLDGTAKGGIVANICHELSIPVRFIGIGEQMEDLRDFDAGEFVEALFGDER